MNVELNDKLSFVDDSHVKHGLRGHVKIELENTETKEKKFWYEDDNIIPISGYQWILMKMLSRQHWGQVNILSITVILNLVLN